MRIRHSAAVALAILVLSVGISVRAAGFTDVISAPIQSIAETIQSAFSQVIAVIAPDRTITVHIAAARWHAPHSAAAAVFNSVAASSTPPTVATTVTVQPQAHADSRAAVILTLPHLPLSQAGTLWKTRTTCARLY
jgi:hypothetical protein